jgi:hypothetical protein
MAHHEQNLPFHAADYKASKGKGTRIKNPSFSISAFENALRDYAADPDFNAIKSTVGRLGDIVEALAAVREQADPTQPAAAVALEYGKQLTKAAESAQRYVQGAASRLQQAQDKAHSAMLAKTRIGTPTAKAAEVRAVMRMMNEKDRLAFMQKSIDTGNAEIMAAILDAPAELSLLSQEVVNQARDQYVMQHAPEYIQVSEALDQAQLRLEMAYDAFLSESAAMRDSGLEFHATQGQQAAKDAKAGLDQLL